MSDGGKGEIARLGKERLPYDKKIKTNRLP